MGDLEDTIEVVDLPNFRLEGASSFDVDASGSGAGHRHRQPPLALASGLAASDPPRRGHRPVLAPLRGRQWLLVTCRWLRPAS